jgi:hypothetical protein
VGQPTIFVGIDVSKDTLDACLLLPQGKERQSAFANDPRGHAALLAWADRYADGLALHFCLEATGPYSEAPADALADAGRLVRLSHMMRHVSIGQGVDAGWGLPFPAGRAIIPGSFPDDASGHSRLLRPGTGDPAAGVSGIW